MEIDLVWRISDSIKLGTCGICLIIDSLHLLSTCTAAAKRRCQWWLLGTTLTAIPLFTFRFAISAELEDWRTWRIFYPLAIICINFAGLEAVQEVAKAHFIYAKNKLFVPKRLYWTYMGCGIYFVVMTVIFLPIILATDKQVFIEVLNACEMLIILGPGMYTVYQLTNIYRFFQARAYHSQSDKQTGPISRPQSRPLGSKNPTSVPAQTQSILSGKITHKHENSVTGSYRNRGDNVAVEEREEEERATPTCASPSSFKNGTRVSNEGRPLTSIAISITGQTGSPGSQHSSAVLSNGLKDSKTLNKPRSKNNDHKKTRHSAKRQKKDKARIDSIRRTLILAAFVVILSGILLGTHISNNIKPNKRASERNVEVYSKYQVRNDFGFIAFILVLVYLVYHSHVPLDLVKLKSLLDNFS
ncbi:hypothetical protein AAMO2058_000685500 [Amorphochlora amoebiformis]